MDTLEYNLEDILELYEHRNNTGLSTGWLSLDNLIRIKTGKLMIITGYPTRGKSHFADNLLLNLTEQHNWKHFVCSFENKASNHFSRIASMITKKPFFKDIGNRAKITKEEVVNIHGAMKENFVFTNNEKMWDIDKIIQNTREMIEERGIKTLTIDPYSRLQRDFKDREDLYIGNMLSKLSAFAKEMNILVIFIAHPKKPIAGNTSAPSFYDISGSADWYNTADYGIVIHRDRVKATGKMSTDTQVHIVKVKDVDLGDPSGGVVDLGFDYRLKDKGGRNV